MLWTLDDPRPDGVLAVEYPYFERTEPIDLGRRRHLRRDRRVFAHTETHEWNHGLGEIVTALLDAG